MNTTSVLSKRTVYSFSNNNVEQTTVAGLKRSKGAKQRGHLLDIGSQRTCDCTGNNINCLTAKEWLKCQLGVWSFNYTKRDIRDKKIHPATFPISLASKVIELFSHKGELVLDPFAGTSTTLIAAQDGERNGVGFDLHQRYVEHSVSRLQKNAGLPCGRRRP